MRLVGKILHGTKSVHRPLLMAVQEREKFWNFAVLESFISQSRPFLPSFSSALPEAHQIEVKEAFPRGEECAPAE